MPSLWKAPARAKPGRNKSIRGTISAPIPIPTGLDDDEFPIRNPGSAKATATTDDEFPIRQPGAGIASPVPPEPTTEEEHHEALPEQKQETQPLMSTEPPQSKEEGSAPLVADGVKAEVSDKSRTDTMQDIQPDPPTHAPPEPPSGNERPASRSPPRKPSSKQASPQRDSPLRSRTTPLARSTNPPISLARYSLISDSPSGQTGNSKDGPQRKKSTLRSAFSKLFGRGRRKNGGGSQDITGPSSRESRLMGSSQHRSDPTALGRAMVDKSPKRSTSLPLTEYDRPLRSHSIGPDDIMAIESARNSLQAEGAAPGTSTGGRRRAATTTSRLLFQSRARNAEWGAGLSPRPASTHGRGSRLANTGEFEDPEEIGRAITSDSGNGSGNARRRSRSLSGLEDLTVRGGGRRRSDEIRFWRESYDPGFMSPLSSNAQEDLDNDDTAMMEPSAPESPAVPPRTPPQPFNFGIIPNTMVGMKITQAVTQAASIETRIDGLETRADRLEMVVGQLCHAVPGFNESRPPHAASLSLAEESATAAYTTAPPVRMPPLPRAISVDTRETPRRYASSHRSIETTDTHSQISFGDAPTFIGSLHPPSSSATQYQSLTVASNPLISPLHRPTSNSTVRGASSLPTLGRDSNNNDDAYASLAAQLDTERAARIALEAQVAKLSERLNTLSSTMFAMIRAPSESRSQERLTPIGGGSSPQLQPPKAIPVPPSTQVLKSLSSFEAQIEDASSLEPRAIGAAVDTEVEEDNFQTPREEQTPLSFGAFGEELRPDDEDEGDADDPKRKKAARTLSLSQLTLKKGQRTQI